MVSNIPSLIIILQVNLITQTSALNPGWTGPESLPVNQHQQAEKMYAGKMILEAQTSAQLDFLTTKQSLTLKQRQEVGEKSHV